MVRELEDLLINKGDDVPLDIAVLQLASIEYPGLDVSYFSEVLDSHGRELAETTDPRMPGEEWVAAANRYLFEDLGFHGNREDYYNARNSCLNDVLTARAGIPITLCVVYMEVARRLGRNVLGIGLPGHFLCKYQDAGYAAFIDCFHGRVLSEEDCRDMALNAAHIDIEDLPRALAPVSKWQIAIRMLNNLRQVYYQGKQYDKAIRVLDLYLAALPGSAEEYKQRGVLHLHQRRPKDALTDLTRYLQLAPHAGDRAEIEDHVRNVRRYLQSLN